MDIFKTLKRKLSVDNLFRGKDDEPLNKDEDVRKTLGKIEPNDIVHVDEIAEKLNELTELSKSLEKSESSQSSKGPDKSKSSYSVLQKTGESEEDKPPDNVMAFLD